jgi:hypothetical protein
VGDWTTTPHDATAGAVLTAANWDATVRDGFNAFGQWTSFTPTLTGFTLGNGTITGRYMRVQKWCRWQALFTFGSTSAAASAAPVFTLPPSATLSSSWPLNAEIGRVTFYDTGTAGYSGIVRITTTTTVGCYIQGTSGQHVAPTTTTPFTWTTGDAIFIDCEGELA